MVKKSKGLPFTYNITMLPDGTSGNEIVVSRRSKAITRATVDIAYQKVSQKITGIKQLGVFSALLLYAIFKKIGVIGEKG